MRPIVSLSTHRGDTRDVNVQILDAWKRWQTAQGLAARTIKDRRDVLTHLASVSGAPLLEVTPDQIIDYVGRPALSQSSRASYHASIRAFYKWAVITGKLTESPAASTPSPRRPKGLPRPIQTAHLSVLLAAANRKRTRAMIILAAYAGLRVHEVAKFRGDDLDRISGIITVTGKGGKTAMIPAHQEILELADSFPQRGYWFPAYGTQTNSPHITSTQVSRAISNTMRRAGFAGKAHQLRHWYATTLLDEGVDVRVVKDLMRHESLLSTEIYTQVSMKRLYAGITALPSAPAALKIAA